MRIAAADLSFSPKPNDQVVIGGKTFQVVSVNTRSPFNEAAIHIVQVRGGNGKSFLENKGPYREGMAILWVRLLPVL